MQYFRLWRQAYQRFQPFTDEEAWLLFRLSALGEAFGWTLLAIGIWCDRLPVGWHHYPVAIAGRIHGTLFLIYATAALVLAPTLRWSEGRTLLAGLCSVPPYGSLVFERWVARQRAQEAAWRLGLNCAYQLVLATE